MPSRCILCAPRGAGLFLNIPSSPDLTDCWVPHRYEGYAEEFEQFENFKNPFKHAQWIHTPPKCSDCGKKTDWGKCHPATWELPLDYCSKGGDEDKIACEGSCP